MRKATLAVSSAQTPACGEFTANRGVNGIPGTTAAKPTLRITHGKLTRCREFRATTVSGTRACRSVVFRSVILISELERLLLYHG
jgi:hypothetical protein